MHQLQHLITTALGALGMKAWVVAGVGLQHAHQHSTFLHLQLACGTVEVALGSGFDAEGVLAEGNRVEVEHQHVLLVQYPLEALRHQGFLHLVHRYGEQPMIGLVHRGS
jgi:hypothetical protein